MIKIAVISPENSLPFIKKGIKENDKYCVEYFIYENFRSELHNKRCGDFRHPDTVLLPAPEFPVPCSDIPAESWSDPAWCSPSENILHTDTNQIPP